MATVIYNHREMEYNCRKFWAKTGVKKPDYCLMLPVEEQRFREIREKLNALQEYRFDEEYAMDYGIDTLRLYVLFEGYPENEDDWKEGSLEGIYKFLNRLMTLVNNSVSATMGIAHNEKKKLRCLQDTEADCVIKQQIEEKQNVFYLEYEKALERSHFHGIVAAFMEYSTNLSQISKKNEVCIDQDVLQEFVIQLAPYAQYMSEYLWGLLGGENSVFDRQCFLKNVSEAISIQMKDIAIQINGKTRKIIQVSEDLGQEQVMSYVMDALADNMPEQIERVIYVPGKVFNMIVH